MSKVKTRAALGLSVLALGAAALVGSGAFADSTKTCTQSDSPHNNWSTTYTQTSACPSSSSVNQSDQTATNGGGNTPAGQQP
jgi:hypothetical protein